MVARARYGGRRELRIERDENVEIKKVASLIRKTITTPRGEMEKVLECCLVDEVRSASNMDFLSIRRQSSSCFGGPRWSQHNTHDGVNALTLIIS